jgi:hypothetical protein
VLAGEKPAGQRVVGDHRDRLLRAERQQIALEGTEQQIDRLGLPPRAFSISFRISPALRSSRSRIVQHRRSASWFWAWRA